MREAEAIVLEMKNKDIEDAYKNGEVREIVALIAYMKSLSQARRTGGTTAMVQSDSNTQADSSANLSPALKIPLAHKAHLIHRRILTRGVL